MAVLESCPKHNMVAYLEKTEGNAEFHEIIDFLTRSSIHHALTARIEADRLLAEKLQEEEREQFTIEERAKTGHKMNEKGIDSSKNEMVKEEDKEEEGTRKRKLGTRKKIKSRKRRYRQDTSEDDSEKDELRLCLTIAPNEEKEVDYEILDKKYPIKGRMEKLIVMKISREIPEVLVGTLGRFDDYVLSSDKISFLELTAGLEYKSTVATVRLKLESEEDRFSTHLASLVKSWLVQDQTVLGKDYSNLLIADSLLKTIWFINAPCYGNEALASPKANDICLGEDVHKLIIRRHKVQFNHAVLNLLSNEMVTYVNVLRPGVLDIVATKSNSLQFNYAVLNLLSNEMVTYVNVLRPGVLDIVATESNSTAVITIQRNLVECETVV
ncbi:hypothetical protein Tco_1403920 [Tanacetum coccineum]